MSLSDYISIFDTRPIAQSHLSEAATATPPPPPPCRTYTDDGAHVRVDTRTHVRTHTRGDSCEEHEERVRRIEARRGEARHGSALDSARQAGPDHTTPGCSSQGPISCVARGVRAADADADSDAATVAVRYCLYRERVRTRA